VGLCAERVNAALILHGRAGMSQVAEELKARTMKFALDVCGLIEEARELLAISSASYGTARYKERSNRKRKQTNRSNRSNRPLDNNSIN
jgi:hypothetical protein